jgi:hypothetical protein
MSKSKRTPEEIATSLPILTTIGFTKTGGLWKVITLRTQGTQVLSVEMSEGDTRAIALEQFKITAANLFLGE